MKSLSNLKDLQTQALRYPLKRNKLAMATYNSQ